jgi:26S proteasome regulatory subunit N12
MQDAVIKDDSATSDRLLTALKIELTKLPALPPRCEASSNAQQQMMLARDVLEYAVISAVKRNDAVSFERNFTQLRPYYLDVRGAMPPSQPEALFAGLHLLNLLVQNRIAEFHMAVELLPNEGHVLSSPEVVQVLQLESWLMEGAYNKVLSARASPASPYYLPLLDRLSTTVRNEIASCSEAAYSGGGMSVAEAARMLRFDSPQELVTYAQARGWKVVDGNMIQFDADDFVSSNKSNGPMPSKNVANGIGSFPAFELIDHCVVYAKELERIV